MSKILVVRTGPVDYEFKIKKWIILIEQMIEMESNDTWAGNNKTIQPSVVDIDQMG